MTLDHSPNQKYYFSVFVVNFEQVLFFDYYSYFPPFCYYHHIIIYHFIFITITFKTISISVVIFVSVFSYP